MTICSVLVTVYLNLSFIVSYCLLHGEKNPPQVIYKHGQFRAVASERTSPVPLQPNTNLIFEKRVSVQQKQHFFLTFLSLRRI